MLEEKKKKIYLFVLLLEINPIIKIGTIRKLKYYSSIHAIL